MKILGLYDIHGNIDALEAVLADPRASDPDVVVVGGDAVPGPFARATLERLRSLSAPVRWVRGNGEREVAEAVGGPTLADDDFAARTASLTGNVLNDVVGSGPSLSALLSPRLAVDLHHHAGIEGL
jgi:predicted phosphodiesterase